MSLEMYEHNYDMPLEMMVLNLITNISTCIYISWYNLNHACCVVCDNQVCIVLIAYV